MAIMADISARKAAEAALRASEQKLRNIFNWSLDASHWSRRTALSSSGTRAWSASPGSRPRKCLTTAVGSAVLSLPPEQQTAEHRDFIRQAVRHVTTTGQLAWANQLHENLIKRTDGMRRTIQEIAFRSPTATGFMLCSMVRDTTEQQQAAAALRLSEEQLRRRAAELQGLYSTALRLNAQLEPAELLRLIVEQAADLLDSKAGGVFLYHPELDALQMEVGVGHFWASPPLLLKVGEGLSAKHMPGANR